MEDNCSNCEYSKVRRIKPFCLNKKSIKYRELTSLYYYCDNHKRGIQVEIIDSGGIVIFPK